MSESEAYTLFAEAFGWTPEQIERLTFYEFAYCLKYIETKGS